MKVKIHLDVEDVATLNASGAAAPLAGRLVVVAHPEAGRISACGQRAYWHPLGVFIDVRVHRGICFHTDVHLFAATQESETKKKKNGVYTQEA